MHRLLIGGLAAALCVAVAAPARAQTQQADVPTLLTRVRAYLDTYRSDLAYVIADEDSTQRINRQVPAEPRAKTTRHTKGEIHFRVIGTMQAWIAVRVVTTVDGAPVEDRADLRGALDTRSIEDVVRDFKASNSRFNIGRTQRNFNEPTLALGLLEPARHGTLTFEIRRRRVEDDVTLVTLAFREISSAHPFVVDLKHGHAPVDGEFVVEEATGRIRSSRLRIRLETGPSEAVLTTEYGHDTKLDLWVPTVFRETYETGTEQRAARGDYNQIAFESIYCESRYTNVRRFQVTSRIR